jgi:hypothetical protein
VLWAAKVAKMGFRWNVGNEKIIRFWKDDWFDSCSLAIQFWDLYTIVNEQCNTMSEAWDGVNLKFNFRRTVNHRVMDQWYEVLQIASSISFKEKDDYIIWKFNSKSIYSVQSLYGVINDRGVRHVHTPIMWKINVPPRLHIFQWLLANNKTLTRVNLAKRRKVEDGSCLFCNEAESVAHLFFVAV